MATQIDRKGCGQGDRGIYAGFSAAPPPWVRPLLLGVEQALCAPLAPADLHPAPTTTYNEVHVQEAHSWKALSKIWSCMYKAPSPVPVFAGRPSRPWTRPPRRPSRGRPSAQTAQRWAYLLQPPPASCWPRQGSRSAQPLASAMETRTQQPTPLLAWPLVASGRSKGPSMGPRGLWPCPGEVLLAGSTSMGAALSWAGASASPSTSGECPAIVKPQSSKLMAAVQSGARFQHPAARHVDA